jgi:secreted trypsin-like serine protease
VSQLDKKLIGIASLIAMKARDAMVPLWKERRQTCGQHHIAVFTQVSHYLNWIEDAKNELSRVGE